MGEVKWHHFVGFISVTARFQTMAISSLLYSVPLREVPAPGKMSAFNERLFQTICVRTDGKNQTDGNHVAIRQFWTKNTKEPFHILLHLARGRIASSVPQPLCLICRIV